MTSTPASSPCAPASGASDASSMPVISASMRCRPYMTASAPCTSSAGCIGWASAKPGMRGDGVVDLRVELHRAGAERVHVRVDRPVELREPRVVAHDVELRQLGQAEVVAQQLRRDGVGRRRDVGRGQRRRPMRPGRESSRRAVRFDRVVGDGHRALRSRRAPRRGRRSRRGCSSPSRRGACGCAMQSLTSRPPMMPRSSSARLISATGFGVRTTNSWKNGSSSLDARSRASAAIAIGERSAPSRSTARRRGAGRAGRASPR